ncbi:MAG: PKD domain-containing protein [Methanobacteriota archaeon]|nr:MAG: PKD domain-containing protein [Euryarchaeota archaeon]
MRGERRQEWSAGGRRLVTIAVAWVLALTIIASAIMIATGPAAAGVVPRASSGPRVLRIGVAGLTAVTLNPNDITLVLEFTTVYNVYSTLATRDEGLNLVPDIATSWSVAADQVTWTFHIVRSAYFTDPANPTDKSHPLNADDVVFSYNMIKDNSSSSVLGSYVSFLDTITRVDDYTVRMTTGAPFAAMNATITVIPIFPKYLWQSISDPVANEPPGPPVGSGAMYYDANSDLASHIILHRSPNYYGDATYCNKVRPDEVRYLLYTASSTLIDDFGSGTSRLDAIYNIPSASFVNAASLNQPTVTKIQVAGGFVGEVSSNVLTDSLRAYYVANGNLDFATGHNNQVLATNLVVRQAIAMSIDRAAILRYAYQNLGTVGDTLVPPVNPWHYSIPPAQQYHFNTTAARQLLNAAGWTYDSGGVLNPSATPLYKTGMTEPLIFRFYTPNNHPEFEPAVANISVWLRQAGIVTTDSTGATSPGYEVKDVNQMGSIWSALDYDIWLWDWVFSRVSDPSLDVLQVQTSSAVGVLSDNGYANSTFDDLYNQSLVTRDLAARRSITDRMQKMVYDYASYILPYYPNDLYAVTSNPNLGSGWLDWGDWPNEPGLTVDSGYAAPWFHIVAPDNRPPVISAFPAVDYVAGQPTTLSAIASDPEGGSLSFTWDFGDGTNPATTMTNSVLHTFASPGTYSVQVRVADSEWPVCASTTATISPAAADLPPVATLNVNFPVSGHGWSGESITVTATVRDPEGDQLFVNWTFGDGTTAADHLTSTTPNTDTTVTQTHTYTNPGNYSLNVTVTDGHAGAGHNQLKSSTVPIWPRPSASGPAGTAGLNPLINYGVPAAIVAVILIAAAVIYIRRGRARREEERQDEPPREQPPPP